MYRFILLTIVVLFSLQSRAKDFLFQNGKSEYSIVLPSTASESEQTAANELQSYLKQIAGVTLPIVSKMPQAGHFIYIGYNSKIAKTKPNAADESFTYKKNSGNLYIYGGKDRGTMYGVFAFLENELGVRWYTSDYTKIPTLKEYSIPSLNHTEQPVVKKRLDFCYGALTDAVWCAHNRLNQQHVIVKNKYGNIESSFGFHTMFDLVPPDSLFESHPEYYSLIKGKRQCKISQLCLTNKEVLAITKKSVIKMIKDNPGYWTYDVSQMDNQNYCQCDNCTRMAEHYGGQSGLMIWFVNQVADAVSKAYPGIKVSTFAYQYTRHAPVGIKPRSNVVVRLCDIECCFSHPLSSSKCEKNKDFMKDLSDWGKLTRNIYIWDYVVNFHNYLVPFPDFTVLAQNIKTFADNGAIDVLEEGVHECPWGEFSEMRQWVLAQLLWNPDLSTDRLVKEFCQDYYGHAGDDIYHYYQLTQNVPSDFHLMCNQQYEKEIYDDDFVSNSMAIVQTAYNKIKGDKALEQRVNRVLAQVYYLYTCKNPAVAKKNGIYQKLKTILKNDPTNIMEDRQDLDQHLKEQGYT